MSHLEYPKHLHKEDGQYHRVENAEQEARAAAEGWLTAKQLSDAIAAGRQPVAEPEPPPRKGKR